MVPVTRCEFCGEIVPLSSGRCPKCGGNVKPESSRRLWLFFALVVAVMVAWALIERLR